MTIPLRRGPSVFAVLFLAASVGTGCGLGVRYPEPGDPGPVITEAGDTIPAGPDRIAFMAGYRAGYERAREEGGPYGWEVLGGLAGAAVTTVFLPLTLYDYRFAPFPLAGLGLIWLAARVDDVEPLRELPAPVMEQGALFQAGYRDGYVRGLRLEPRKQTALGVALGVVIGLVLLWNALST